MGPIPSSAIAKPLFSIPKNLTLKQEKHRNERKGGMNESHSCPRILKIDEADVAQIVSHQRL